ncbi:unnamed protein product [Sphagnum tenellum]
MGPSQRMSSGTAILVDRKIAPLVVDNGILMGGKAQFIKLQAAGSGTLTIVNVYATQTSRNQTLLWKTISRVELDSDNTIIGGDFNHQEETSYRGIANERQPALTSQRATLTPPCWRKKRARQPYSKLGPETH